jgi:hypothetical protein
MTIQTHNADVHPARTVIRTHDPSFQVVEDRLKPSVLCYGHFLPLGCEIKHICFDLIWITEIEKVQSNESVLSGVI